MTHTGIKTNEALAGVPRVKLNRSIPVNVYYIAPSGEYTIRNFDLWFSHSRESMNRLISWAMINNIELRINSAIDHEIQS